MENADKIRVFAETRFITGETRNYAFYNTALKTLSYNPPKDFYIPLLLTRNFDMTDYVDVSTPTDIYQIPRQNVNPWFFEFGIVDGCERIKVSDGANLTVEMIGYLKFLNPSIKNMTNSEVQSWFNDEGRNSFPMSGGTVSLDDITLSDSISSNLISKLQLFGIDRNSNDSNV